MSDNEISRKCPEQVKFYQIMQILGLVGGSDYKDWIKYLLRKQQKEAQVKKPKPNQTTKLIYCVLFCLAIEFIYRFQSNEFCQDFWIKLISLQCNMFPIWHHLHGFPMNSKVICNYITRENGRAFFKSFQRIQYRILRFFSAYKQYQDTTVHK